MKFRSHSKPKGTAAANGAFGQLNFTNANNDLAGFSQDKKDAVSCSYFCSSKRAICQFHPKLSVVSMQMAGLGLSGDAQSVATTVLACKSTFTVMICTICCYGKYNSMICRYLTKIWPRDDGHVGNSSDHLHRLRCRCLHAHPWCQEGNSQNSTDDKCFYLF